MANSALKSSIYALTRQGHHTRAESGENGGDRATRASTVERKDAGHRQWRVDPKSRSMKCVGCKEGHGRQDKNVRLA